MTRLKTSRIIPQPMEKKKKKTTSNIQLGDKLKEQKCEVRTASIPREFYTSPESTGGMNIILLKTFSFIEF